jgi:hypothetical protein
VKGLHKATDRQSSLCAVELILLAMQLLWQEGSSSSRREGDITLLACMASCMHSGSKVAFAHVMVAIYVLVGPCVQVSYTTRRAHHMVVTDKEG